MGKQFLEITEKKEVEKIIADLSVKVAKAIAAETEKVRISEALGRIASSDIFSPLDIPPFDRSTMDGYAVIASDTFYSAEDNPSSLIIKGYIQAGEFPSHQYIEKGYCTGISTGAPIPKGANAVVKIENAFEFVDAVEVDREAFLIKLFLKVLVAKGKRKKEGKEEGAKKLKKVKIYKPVAPAENVMPAGSDIKRGEKIIRNGTTLTPRENGVLAACGLKEVFVRKKPVVAIISTGNELVAPGEEKLEPGKIYDVNAQTISDSVGETGCVPLFLGIAADSLKEISAKMKDSLAKRVDVIIISGGTSAGVGDVLPMVIEGLGEILMHGVDIKPGKPFILGIVQGKPVFGLPGNPTSALVTFNLFVAPLLRTMSCNYSYKDEEGEGEGGRRKKVKAKAAVRIFSEPGRNEYVLVNLVKKLPEEESFFAYPILSGSGAITTLSKADGYIFVEKGKEIIEEGEGVEVEVFF